MTIPLDWLVWAVPIAAAPFVALFGRLGGKVREVFALLVSFASAAMSILLLYTSPIPRESSISLLSAYNLSFQVVTDGLSIFLSLIVNLLGFLIILYSTGYMKRETGQDRYYALVLLFIGSMTGLVMAGNLLQLYIFWELVGICSSFLIAFWYDRPEAVRAGLKAFIVTRVGDIGLLAGLVYIYINTHTFSFSALTSLASSGLISSTILTVGGLLVFAGAIGKSAQFPLHVWLPDAMEGPSTVSALIHAATMVNAGVYLVARVYPIFVSDSVWLITVGSIGATSALLAASMAMATPDLKRVLAYSTISQLGLMFTALGIGTSLGLFSAQLHLMSQAAFKALGFLAAGSVVHVLGTRDMDHMGGLARRMPITFLAFAFSVLAMTGLPPFIGFWSKDLILASSLNNASFVFSVVILLVSVMTAFYSFRALFRVFIDKPLSEEGRTQVHESSLAMTIPLTILSVSVLLLFVTIGPLSDLLKSSATLNLDPLTVLLSALAFVVGLTPAYLVYIRRGNYAPNLVAHYRLLRLSQRLLVAGYGFDRLYDLAIVRPTIYLAGKTRRLQTGILGINLWALIVVVALLILVVLI
ncbi:MAG TPA: NADH-quinone oxidoreductase subunit L [Candidatus Bathyarchaeia archaeon]|nr:NADH-quinone oxidoreductase subunit L [Candidatus Bathyarchaeia archaeon]